MPRIEIRCSREDKVAWMAKAEAAGVNLSDLVRKSLDRVRTWTASDRRAHRERICEMARIGNNLNQIAKWVNTYKGTAESVQVMAALVEIEQAVKELHS